MLIRLCWQILPLSRLVYSLFLHDIRRMYRIKFRVNLIIWNHFEILISHHWEAWIGDPRWWHNWQNLGFIIFSVLLSVQVSWEKMFIINYVLRESIVERLNTLGIRSRNILLIFMGSNYLRKRMVTLFDFLMRLFRLYCLNLWSSSLNFKLWT